MISTRVLLVFVTLAPACIAGGNTSLPHGCRPISGDSFKSHGQTATERPPSLALALGKICEIRLHKSEQNITCLGDAGVGLPKCRMCCACRGNDGNIQYNKAALPNNFPCGPNKKTNDRLTSLLVELRNTKEIKHGNAIGRESAPSAINHESSKLKVECFNSRADYR
uniref:Putative salivary secreted protein n=1 Tax=Ixodes ricinus TaxID=34613 RepID=A0A090X9K9_IXORI